MLFLWFAKKSYGTKTMYFRLSQYYIRIPSIRSLYYIILKKTLLFIKENGYTLKRLIMSASVMLLLSQRGNIRNYAIVYLGKIICVSIINWFSIYIPNQFKTRPVLLLT